MDLSYRLRCGFVLRHKTFKSFNAKIILYFVIFNIQHNEGLGISMQSIPLILFKHFNYILYNIILVKCDLKKQKGF